MEVIWRVYIQFTQTSHTTADLRKTVYLVSDDIPQEPVGAVRRQFWE